MRRLLLPLLLLLIFLCTQPGARGEGGTSTVRPPAGGEGESLSALLFRCEWGRFLERSVAETASARSEEEAFEALELTLLASAHANLATLRRTAAVLARLQAERASFRLSAAIRRAAFDTAVRAGLSPPPLPPALLTDLRLFPPLVLEGKGVSEAEGCVPRFAPSARGLEPVERARESGVFEPAADCGPGFTSGHAALYGALLHVPQATAAVLYVTSNSDLAFFLGAPFGGKNGEGGTDGLSFRRPDAFLPGTPGLFPAAPTGAFRVRLPAGDTPFFVLVSARPGARFSLAISPEAGDAAVEVRPLSSAELFGDKNTKRSSITIEPIKINNTPYVLFPAAGTSRETWLAARGAFSERLPRDILEADYLLRLGERKAAAEFAARTARAVLSPLVADWLALLGSPALPSYDARCLERFPAAAGPWLRTHAGEKRREVLLDFIRRNGPSVALLNALRSLGDAASVRAAFELAGRVPFDAPLLAGLAASEALPPEDRISLITSLEKAGAASPSLLAERVRLLTVLDDLDSAAEHCAALCRSWPWVAKFWADLGGIYRASGRPSLCMRAWRAALAVDPAYPHLNMLLDEVREELEGGPLHLRTTPEELARLKKEAAPLPSPLGLVELKREYALETDALGRLKGVVYRLVLVTRDTEKLRFSTALKEWEGFDCSVKLRRCVLHDSDGAERLAAVDGGLVTAAKVGKGTVLELVQKVVREPDPLFAPGAYEFIPAARVGLPLLHLRYELKTERPLKWWVSKELSARFEDGVLVVENARPLVWCDAPMPPLPSLGWSELDGEETAACFVRELERLGNLSGRAAKLAEKRGSSRERFAADYNALRRLLAPREAEPGRFFSARRPEFVFSAGKATAMEFAALFLAALRESGVADEVAVALVCGKGSFPWEAPPPEAGFFCPALASDVLFVLDDGGGPLPARCLSPLSLSPDKGHFCRLAASLGVLPFAGPLAVRGFEGTDFADWFLALSASDRGEVSCSLRIRMGGTPAERLASAFGREKRKAAAALTRLLARWMGPVRGIEDALELEYGPESVRITVSYFMLDWSGRKVEERRFSLSPAPPDLSGAIVSGGEFSPAWSGALRLRFALSGPLEAASPCEGEEEETPFGKLLFRREAKGKGEVLEAAVTVRDGAFPLERLEEFKKFAARAERLLEGVVRWKTGGTK